MMSIPVKYTLKRRLNDDEIEQISNKRFRALETDYTADENQSDDQIENENEYKNEKEYEIENNNITVIVPKTE